MPWTAADAPSHNKDCEDNDQLSQIWAKAANAALDDGKDDAAAIAAANAAVAEEMKKSDSDRKQKLGEIVFRREARLAPAPSNGPPSLDEATREIDMVISTGAAVRRRDWWDDFEYDEVLSMDPKAIRMDRLQAGAPLLDSHNWYCGLEAMVGSTVPGSARVEKKELLARARFSRNSELGVRVFNDLRDGIRIPLSAGYKIHAFKEDRTTSPPTRTITDWEPVEVSLVSVPAEETGTGFRSAPGHQRGSQPRREATSRNKETTMLKIRRLQGESDADFKARISNELKTNHAIEGETAEQLAKRVEEAFDLIKGGEDQYARQKANEAQQARELDAILKRREERRQRGLDPDGEDDDEPGTGPGQLKDFLAIGRQAGMNLQEIEQMVRPKMTVHEFRAIAFDFLSKKKDNGQIKGATGKDQEGNAGRGGGGYGQTAVLSDHLEARNAAMADALATQLMAARRVPAIITDDQREWCKAREITDQVGLSMRIMEGKEQPRIPQAREFMDKSIVELAAICIGHKFRATILRPGEADEIMRRAYHSTGDFPAIFENALNKTLLARYAVAMPTYREIAMERTFNDFRPHPQIRAGDFPQPQEVTETGEIKYGTASDSKETVSVKPYGIAFSISRQMIINDDKSGIDQILGSTGTGILRFENTTFFTMMLSNGGLGPVLLQDAKNVYTFGTLANQQNGTQPHSNYIGSGNTPAAPSIQSISQGRQYLRGMKTLDGQFLNVNPTIILTGPVQETVAEQMVTQITPAVTSSVNPFQNRLRPVTEAAIPGTAWYLFADPQALPCFVYGFLAGSGGPRVRTDEPFGVQGVRVSLEHDFGCGAIDYRGSFQNFGA